MLFRRMLISLASGHFSARSTEGTMQPIRCSTRHMHAQTCTFLSFLLNTRSRSAPQGASPSFSLLFKCLRHQARAHAKSPVAETKGGPQPRLKLSSWLLTDVQLCRQHWTCNADRKRAPLIDTSGAAREAILDAVRLEQACRSAWTP
jgi:hypothetical protein